MDHKIRTADGTAYYCTYCRTWTEAANFVGLCPVCVHEVPRLTQITVWLVETWYTLIGKEV